MNSNRSHSNSSKSRFEGCTITGALAVTAFVSDGITIIHGPAGCTNHNLSLLHSTILGIDHRPLPRVLSTALSEQQIIFGGEERLEKVIASAAAKRPGAIFVISTCVVETIGDDVTAVCARDWGVPVLAIPSGGFLGGSFQDGFMNALIALEPLVGVPEDRCNGVNIIGEKNLEYEATENYREVKRLLDILGIPVNVRYIRDTTTGDLSHFGSARLNILRDESLVPIGERFRERYGIPFIVGFPVGLEGSIRFIEDIAEACAIDAATAISEEQRLQAAIRTNFGDLRGRSITFEAFGFQCAEFSMLREVAEAVGLTISPEGTELPVPIGAPVGTTGVRRMLHQWRRFLHA
jgi:nitrogenase molybdenum-iron protein alpha/beta subunit